MSREEVREKIDNIIKRNDARRDVLKKLLKEDGFINVQRLIAEGFFPEEVTEKDVLGVNDLKPCKIYWPELKEAYETVEEKHFGKLTAYVGTFLSAKRAWDNEGNQVISKIEGQVNIGGEYYRYESRIGKPTLGKPHIIWCFPTLIEKGKKRKKKYPLIKVYGFTAIVEDLIEDIEIKIRNMDDVRGCFPKIVGEDKNICASVLAIISRLNKNKDFHIMGIVVRGVSSAGKNHLVKYVVMPWQLLGRVEDFSRLTGAFMERNFAKIGDSLNDKILIIYELSGNTPQQLHIVLSEGKLRVGIIDKDTGDPVEYVFEGTPFLFSTTPAENLRTDLLNRIMTLTIDESNQQTERIVDLDILVAEDPDKGIELESDVESNARMLASYLIKLEKMYVVVPFARVLKKGIKSFNVNLRRDWKKLLAIIQASALLFQKQRPKTYLRSGEQAIVATVEDYKNMMEILPILSQTLTKLTEPQKRLLDIMCEEKPETQSPTLDDVSEQPIEWTVKDVTRVANKVGWSISARRVRQILNELETLGYVVVEKKSGKNYYMVLHSAIDVDFVPLEDEIEKAVEAYLKSHVI